MPQRFVGAIQRLRYLALEVLRSVALSSGFELTPEDFEELVDKRHAAPQLRMAEFGEQLEKAGWFNDRLLTAESPTHSICVALQEIGIDGAKHLAKDDGIA